MPDSELAFDANEVQQLVADQRADEAVAPLIFSATHGWPLATMSLAARVADSGPTAAFEQIAVDHENLIGDLARTYLAELGQADVEAAGSLATLPFFDETVAELQGRPGLISRLRAAGVPVTRRADGWFEIAEQFRQSLLQPVSYTHLTLPTTPYV